MSNIYNEILFIHKTELSAATCYNIDTLWKHYAKRNKLDTEGHILYDSTYIKCLE